MGTSSSGRGCLRGRPRRRFTARTLPFRSNWPPHTPHGSARAMAPSRQGTIAGQVAQMAFACAISPRSSEKNSEVGMPSLRQVASSIQSIVGVVVSGAIISPSPSLLGGYSLRLDVVLRGKTRKAAGFPAASGTSLSCSPSGEQQLLRPRATLGGVGKRIRDHLHAPHRVAITRNTRRGWHVVPGLRRREGHEAAHRCAFLW